MLFYKLIFITSVVCIPSRIVNRYTLNFEIEKLTNSYTANKFSGFHSCSTQYNRINNADNLLQLRDISLKEKYNKKDLIMISIMCQFQDKEIDVNFHIVYHLNFKKCCIFMVFFSQVSIKRVMYKHTRLLTWWTDSIVKMVVSSRPDVKLCSTVNLLIAEHFKFFSIKFESIWIVYS